MNSNSTIQSMNIDNTGDVKTSAFCLLVSIFSGVFKLIPIETLVQGIIIAFISTVIGFYGNKALKSIDNYFKERSKKNKEKA